MRIGDHHYPDDTLFAADPPNGLVMVIRVETTPVDKAVDALINELCTDRDHMRRLILGDKAETREKFTRILREYLRL